MSNQITVRDFIREGEYKDGAFLFHGQCVYLSTFSGEHLVGHIRWPVTDPWAVCPKANGGFGLSFCVSYETPLILKPA